MNCSQTHEACKHAVCLRKKIESVPEVNPLCQDGSSGLNVFYFMF